MTNKLLRATAGALILLAPLSAGAQQRHAGAHQHGHGTLNIVIEATRVSMELDVPGADIVGFEHAAKTKAQRDAVDSAKGKLNAPLSLFALPAAAGCTLRSATVKTEGEGQAPAKGEEQHADFNAEYEFECASPANVTTIEFPYFKAFPKTEALTVNLVTPKGQTSLEVKRGKPVLSLAGIM